MPLAFLVSIRLLFNVEFIEILTTLADKRSRQAGMKGSYHTLASDSLSHGRLGKRFENSTHLNTCLCLLPQAWVNGRPGASRG